MYSLLAGSNAANPVLFVCCVGGSGEYGPLPVVNAVKFPTTFPAMLLKVTEDGVVVYFPSIGVTV
jgi:hypothetical protein